MALRVLATLLIAEKSLMSGVDGAADIAENALLLLRAGASARAFH